MTKEAKLARACAHLVNGWSVDLYRYTETSDTPVGGWESRILLGLSEIAGLDDATIDAIRSAMETLE